MTDSRLRVGHLFTIIIPLVLISSTLSAVPGEARASAFNCAGKDPQHILARYGYAASGAEYPVPLRCGNRSWGYRHFSSRWGNNFESHLERALNGSTFRQRQGTTRLVCRLVNAGASRKWFKAVHTTQIADRGKGIITAVWEGDSGTCDKIQHR
ncbi:hypothetical protein GCM10017673_04760 [Streptosporangium violaceochromogenes]|nr:hypothetical protein GCM10017673_04760 [Streptosporangium violaceochromogenes]